MSINRRALATLVVAGLVAVAAVGFLALRQARRAHRPQQADSPAPVAPVAGGTASSALTPAVQPPGAAPPASAAVPPQPQPAPASGPRVYPPEEAPPPAPSSPVTTREQWLEEITVGQLGLGPDTIRRNADIFGELGLLHAKYVTTIEQLLQQRQKAFEKAHAEHYTVEQAGQLQLEWRRQMLPHEQALLADKIRILQTLRSRLSAGEVEALDKFVANLSRLWESNRQLEAGAQGTPLR